MKKIVIYIVLIFLVFTISLTGFATYAYQLQPESSDDVESMIEKERIAYKLLLVPSFKKWYGEKKIGKIEGLLENNKEFILNYYLEQLALYRSEIKIKDGDFLESTTRKIIAITENEPYVLYDKIMSEKSEWVNIYLDVKGESNKNRYEEKQRDLLKKLNNSEVNEAEYQNQLLKNEQERLDFLIELRDNIYKKTD